MTYLDPSLNCTWCTKNWACTFYTAENKSEKVGCNSEELNKLKQIPYNSVQKAELYAMFMVLRGF